MKIRDLYDENRKLTGETILKGEAIPNGSYYVVVTIFIQNSKGELLLQRRSQEKSGKWATTGGHPKAGESSLDGIITQVKEELGLDIKNENIILYDSKKDDYASAFRDYYYVNMEVDPSTLNYNEHEVSDVKWFTIDEVKEMVKTKEFHKDYAKMFNEFLEYLNNK